MKLKLIGKDKLECKFYLYIKTNSQIKLHNKRVVGLAMVDFYEPNWLSLLKVIVPLSLSISLSF